eukprot:g15098.t1
MLRLRLLSLRYSSWGMRPWLVLTHAGAQFNTITVDLPNLHHQGVGGTVSAPDQEAQKRELAARRQLGSVRGLFPVLQVGNTAIHESLAICEYVADLYPDVQLWPRDPLARAQARALCCEMVSGFSNMRGTMSSHLFARVPHYTPSPAAQMEIERVFEIWSGCLERERTGKFLFGPFGKFLFGPFGIVDAMYFPILGRFRTYGVKLPAGPISKYAAELEASRPVQQLLEVARTAPHVTVYDDYVRSLGGNPDAAA